jgi:hypothetical protein
MGQRLLRHPLCAKPTVQTALQQLVHVQMMSREMIAKYEHQHAECTREVRATLGDRPRALRLMRKRKILEGHIAGCEQRLHACMQKQCALEQLELTKLQIDALQQSSNLFRRFSRRHSLEKIEALTATMQELSDDLLDMNDLLQTPLQPVDDETVLEELAALEAEVALPQVPSHCPVATVAAHVEGAEGAEDPAAGWAVA